jgi:hypothetical protein
MVRHSIEKIVHRLRKYEQHFAYFKGLVEKNDEVKADEHIQKFIDDTSDVYDILDSYDNVIQMVEQDPQACEDVSIVLRHVATTVFKLSSKAQTSSGIKKFLEGKS